MKTQLEIEVDILKSRITSLEQNQQWLTHNWVEWTSETKETGQKLMIALSEVLKQTEDDV
jgi:hypothetical protein